MNNTILMFVANIYYLDNLKLQSIFSERICPNISKIRMLQNGMKCIPKIYFCIILVLFLLFLIFSATTTEKTFLVKSMWKLRERVCLFRWNFCAISALFVFSHARNFNFLMKIHFTKNNIKNYTNSADKIEINAISVFPGMHPKKS